MCSNLERSSRRPTARSVQADEILLTVPFAARWHFVPYDYWRFTPSSFRYLLETTGFSDGRGVRARQRLHRCLLQGDRTLPALPLPDSRRSAYTTGASSWRSYRCPSWPFSRSAHVSPCRAGVATIASATPLPPSAGEHARARGSRLPAVRIGRSLEAFRRGALRPDSSRRHVVLLPKGAGGHALPAAGVHVVRPSLRPAQSPRLATLVDAYREAEYESAEEARHAATTYADALAHAPPEPSRSSRRRRHRRR